MTNVLNTTTTNTLRRIIMAVVVLAVSLPLLVIPAQKAEAATAARMYAVCDPSTNTMIVHSDADYLWVFIYKWDATVQDFIIHTSKSRWMYDNEKFDIRDGLTDGYYAARVFNYYAWTNTMDHGYVNNFTQHYTDGSRPTTGKAWYCQL